MYTVRMPGGEFLDTQANFTLDFELNNQVFSSNATALPGSYTFPVDVPLTDHNRRLLSNPQLIQNRYKFRSIPGVIVYCHGIELFTGELRITDAGPKKVRMTIISNPVRPMRDIGLNELDLGGERSAGGTDENLGTFAAAAERPDDYDYTLFPVYAPDFDATTADITDNDYINWWNSTEYTFSLDSVALILFPKVEYLLSRMFAELVPDFSFINAWQITRELRRLYVLNNFDSRVVVDGNILTTQSNINLKNHVGTMKCADFLKAIMARFCLGLFTSPFKKKIVLRALRDIVSHPARLDWSNYVLADYNITDDQSDTPMKFQDPALNGTTERGGEIENITTYLSWIQFNADLPFLSDGIYYIETTETLWEVNDDSGFPFPYYLGKKRRAVILDESPVLEGLLAPPATYRIQGDSHYPWYEQPGSYWENQNPDGVAEWLRIINEFDLQLIFYRGFQSPDAIYLPERPYASVMQWRPDAPLPTPAVITTKDSGPSGAITIHGPAQYSLLWSGDSGLYQQWWKQWHDVLSRGKHVTRRFTLPVAELTAFSFEEKVRIHNVEYMVKRLRVSKALDNGRVLVEASMITCV